MDRRKFLKQLGMASIAPIVLNGISINALAANSTLMKMLSETDSNRVLIFIQMHGGNDGLNTIIPVKKYDDYYNVRANVAIPNHGERKYIPLDDSLPEEDKLGLHPDMRSVKELYDQKAAAVVQAVGYDNMNLSHFRSRDIWFMGCDSDDHISSSWMGRFLENEYPGYPDKYPSESMPDPLGLELGNEVTLAFQQENNIPAGLSIANPKAFYNLINSVGMDAPLAAQYPDNYYGDEMRFLTQFEDKAEDYAERLKEVWDKGKNTEGVVYPDKYPLLTPKLYMKNPLSEQFKIIARLLSGGIKTRIFMTRITGFDTHANQVEETDASQGRHAALLYHISEAVGAFYKDLKGLGLDKRVLTLTFSEFGRRVYSNASFGTDHGKAAPILLFGAGLKGGVYGTNPNLQDLDNGNLKHQFDYRQVYTSILSDWFGAPDSAIKKTGFGEYLDKKLDLIDKSLAVNDLEAYTGSSKLQSCYPNPARDTTKIEYYIDENTHVVLRLYSSSGQMVRELVNKNQSKGNHQVELNVSGLRTGNYIYSIKAGKFSASKILLVD